jgi:hypothetical protein
LKQKNLNLKPKESKGQHSKVKNRKQNYLKKVLDFYEIVVYNKGALRNGGSKK